MPQEFGSVTNILMDRSKPIAPEPGMGCTILMWTDRHAATIVRVHPNGKRMWIREDIATRTDKNGMSESQTYDFCPNPEAPEQECRLLKRGWRVVGRGCGVLIGHRSEYHDFSF